MEPALPMLNIDPALPMLRIEPELPILRIEPALPMLRNERMPNRLPRLKKLYALYALARLPRLRQLSVRIVAPRVLEVAVPVQVNNVMFVSDFMSGDFRISIEATAVVPVTG